MKLFVVNNARGEAVSPYFTSKTEAKEYRNTLNAQPENAGHVIAVGPDHRRFK